VKSAYTLCLLFGMAAGRAFAGDVLFENSTEDSTAGWEHVTPAFAKALMKHEAKIQDLSGYAEAGEIPADPSKRLVWQYVQINQRRTPAKYVRPTLEPYFSPFYGAHQFRHWLVLNGKIIYEGDSDIFQILRADHAGMRDIAETACTAVTCYTTQYLFNQQSMRYESGACTATSISTGTSLGPCK
jgi:hypothetical protein